MPDKTASKTPASYHHGDLRNALILAAAQLIEESGQLDFAMIDAARLAGVSNAAPYRHFKDKAALLEAVAQLAFLGLTDQAQKAMSLYREGSEAQIIGLGKAYIGFVTSHPQFYELMWGGTGQRALNDADLKVKSTGFYLLVATVEAWCEQHNLYAANAVELAGKLWAMAHGLSALALHQHLEKFLPEVDIYALLESTTHAFLEGVRGGA